MEHQSTDPTHSHQLWFKIFEKKSMKFKKWTKKYIASYSRDDTASSQRNTKKLLEMLRSSWSVLNEQNQFYDKFKNITYIFNKP